MSDRDIVLTLAQIVDFADEVTSLLAKHVRRDLDHDLEFRRALERCIELIGEAATRLPVEWRAQHAEVPWRQIISMRNVLVHAYDVILPEVLWSVAVADIPRVRGSIARLINQHPNNE